MLFEATAWEIGEAVHPAPDPVGGARRGRARRRRQVDQLLTQRGRRQHGERAEAWRHARPNRRSRRRAARRRGRLGADLGLTRDDLLEMYRLVALARALDERMWILNRAGKIPFVISGQGHEGAQVGIAYGLQKGLDWMVPVLPLGGQPHHLRHDAARDHARPVRPRRATRARAAARCPATTASPIATSCRSARRSPRRCCTPRASPARPSCARPARSRSPTPARARATRATSTRP